MVFISVEKHHPVFFSLVCSSFSRSYVCKQPSVFQAASFGHLLLNEKQKKPFVSLKDEVSITQLFLTAASLAQVDNALNEADSNLFCRDTWGLDSRSVKSFLIFVLFFFFFQKPSSCLCNWIAVLLVRNVFLASIVTLAFGAQSIDYFDSTNSELTCLLSRVCLLFPPIFEAYSRNIYAHLVGDLASLSLWPSLSHQHSSKKRGVFLFRDHGLGLPLT